MKAAVCREFGKPLVIEDVELAEPSEGEVRVKLGACAICHSDIIFADGGWGGDLPVVLGHEAAGTVTAIGAGVDSVKSGDYVVVTLIRHCGSCYYCDQGDDVMCDASFPLDENSPLRSSAGESIFQGLRTGAFAEEVVVGATQVCAIPDVIPVECASLLACGVLTGVGAVINTAKVSPGSNVVVIGAGGVGLNAIQGAALADANTVIAIDIAADKLEAARSFGATHAINSVSEDATSTVLQETGGRGADYVFVTVGAKTAIDQSVQMLGRGGTAVIVGMPESGVMAEYDPSELASRSQKIIGSKMGSARISADIPRLVKLYQEGHLKLDELVSGRYPLEDINDAIASVKDGMALRNVVIF